MNQTKIKRYRGRRLFFSVGGVTMAVIVAVFLSFNFSTAQEDVGQINEQIKERKTRIEELQDKAKELQQSIDARRSQAVSLENQMSILNNQVFQTETEIELTENEIESTKLEIAKTKAEITQAELEIEELKIKLSALLRERYRLDQRTAFEILLSSDTISAFFNQVETVERFQGELALGLDELKLLRQELSKRVVTLEDKQVSLEDSQNDLEGKRDRLASQSSVRAQILSDTRNSEARFQDLLRQAKAEQVEINSEIQSLEQVIRQRLAGQGPGALSRLGGSGEMIYPVPFKGITAFFHDPSYPYRYIFEHPAIDVRASQATPVRAANSGFVARARDAGLGYSYVMIIHADGLSTVYGHVSKILVQEDQFVTQGEVVALSGGLPGTPGAGRLTTGPHLHFEVRQNGIPVNPLNYLP